MSDIYVSVYNTPERVALFRQLRVVPEGILITAGKRCYSPPAQGSLEKLPIKFKKLPVRDLPPLADTRDYRRRKLPTDLERISLDTHVSNKTTTSTTRESYRRPSRCLVPGTLAPLLHVPPINHSMGPGVVPMAGQVLQLVAGTQVVALRSFKGDLRSPREKPTRVLSPQNRTRWPCVM